MPTPPESLKSYLLVASPDLGDPNFARTVVLLIEHGSEGALGIVLNRPLDRPISEFWAQIGESETDCQAPAYWGGPVAGPLMVVHRVPGYSEIEVVSGVYFTADRSNIDAVMAINDPEMRFYIGCAGWSEGQLESEIEEGAWEYLPANEEFICDGTAELWSKVGEHLHARNVLDQFRVKHVPPDPNLN